MILSLLLMSISGFCQNAYELETPLSYSESHFFYNHQFLRNLIQENNVQTIVEIGPYFGDSTIWMAESLPENGQIYAIDSWVGYPIEHYEVKRNFYKRFLSNIILSGLQERVTPIRMTSLSASQIFSQYAEKVDMVYIDGDHCYEAVYSDISAWSPYVRGDGILCGNLFSNFGEKETIKKAVKDYAKKEGKSFFFEENAWIIR